MRKPVPWKEPARLTVEASGDGKPSAMNPVDVDTAIGPEAPSPKPCPSASTPLPIAPTIKPARSTASLPLLMLIGHRESCAELRRAGAVASCDCGIKPMEDPAVAVGLAVHFARISLAQRVALPAAIIELLARRVEEGDAACIMVAEWLDASGLLKLKSLPLSKKTGGDR